MDAPLRQPDTDLLHRIAIEVGTPFYVYDAPILRARVAELNSALPTIDFFYSLKSNPNLTVTGVLLEQGIGCEVSSRLELETAVAAGARPERIIMVGPGKAISELSRAVELGIKAIVVESLDELREIDRLAALSGRMQGVAIRINPDFQSGGARLTMSGRATQFGVDQAELPSVLARLRDLRHIRLRGLHAYMGTRILSHGTIAENVRNILGLASSIEELLPGPLEFVDVGGGFGVPYYEGEQELDLEALGAAIAPTLSSFEADQPDTKVVIELGRFIVAPAGRFVTAVRQTKTSKGERFAVCDGGSNVHSAAAGQGSFLRKNFPISHLPAKPQLSGEGSFEPWTLTGPLCTPQDVIGKSVMLGTPKPGDLICFHQSGAYGPTASPVNFLGFGAPAEILVDDDMAQLIRRRETVAAVLGTQEPQQILLRQELASPSFTKRPALNIDASLAGSPFAHSSLEQLATLEPLFRQAGERLDSDPDAWGGLWSSPLVRALTTIGVPDVFNGFPLGATDLGIENCPYGLHVAMVERLARFDVNSILSLPGPSLSGGAVLATGSREQVERFFRAYRSGPQGTFFAVTEPEAGSDASNGRTKVTRKNGGMVLNGTKMLVGGAKRAEIGLIFAQLEETGRTALIIIEPHRWAEHITIERLKTVGLRGADLCRITLTDFPVTDEMILGDGGRTLRDGFMAINGVFERNRPMVAALALGTGLGILDLLLDESELSEEFNDLRLSHAALLIQLARVVEAYERGRPKAHDISMVKMQAVAFADNVVERVFAQAPRRLLRDTELRRRCRDAKAFEYMEGTSNIHVLNAYRAYTAGVAQ